MANLPNEVITEMAKRSHRMSHFLWHGVRTSWERMNQEQRNAIRAIDTDWEPPRPAHDRNGRTIRSNNSGEDFLFMHREMIKVANEILRNVGDPAYPKVKGWTTLPEPGDAEFPVIPVQGLDRFKSDAYFNDPMRRWENEYKSNEYLMSVTLGELGTDLEFTIHNNMHLRWATPVPVAIGQRPSTPITQPIDTKWDNPLYNNLTDTYASHVHPTFWKIHGWVDDRIEDWKRANNIEEINWIGTWVGPFAHGGHHHMLGMEEDSASNEQFEKMSEIAKILGQTGFDGFIK